MATSDVGAGRRDERRDSVRLHMLAALGDDVPTTEAVGVGVQQVVAGLGAVGGTVHVRDGAGGLRLLALTGLPRTAVGAWECLRKDDPAPPALALREGARVWRPGADPGIGAAGVLALPLLYDGAPLGVLSLAMASPEEPEADGNTLLHAVAAWIAGRLERSSTEVRLPPAAVGRDTGSAVERSHRMAELTVALAEAVTARDVVNVFAQRVLPPFRADGLVVQALVGDRLHVVGSVGYPQEFLNHLEGLSLRANTAACEALRRRAPSFGESPDTFTRRHPAMRSLLAESPKRAWAFLPLVASGRSIGVCVVSFDRPSAFSEDDRTLLIALSGLMAQALERARLYDSAHARAQQLQRDLLPRTLPALPAVTAAARYLPAGMDADVGGDWYDVIPLSSDRVALVIGDVMGRGISEAATMGRLRTAVRTLADLELAPAELFTRLNELVGDMGDDFYTTCLYAVHDPVTGVLSYARAGHPPLAVVRADGTVSLPDGAPDPPLGAARPPFETHELALPGGSLVALCTDGLVESATRDIDQGLAQFTRALTAGTARTAYFTAGTGAGAGHGSAAGADGDDKRLDDLCDFVVSDLLPDSEHTGDDAALLIAHTRRTPAADVASWPLPDDPRAAGQAREHVRAQLAEWHLEDLVMTTELLVSELVGNAVRHGRGPLRLRLLRSRSLICEVCDGSPTTPRIRRAADTDEGGRGLQLVAALADRWGARYLEGGKCIWTEQRRTADTGTATGAVNV